MRVKYVTLIAVTLTLTLFALSGVGISGPPDTATVQFGRPDTGSPFPVPDGHDASTHAKDMMVPRTVVISAGGTVTYEIAPFHRVAIYEPGTTPDDIDTTLTVGLVTPFPIPAFSVDDPAGRLAVSNPDFTALSLAPVVWDTPAGTFDEPGRYLA